MDFGSWQKSSTDVVRLRRLAGGSMVGVCIIGGTLTVVGLTAAKAYHLDEDQVVEAALVTSPEEEAHVEAEPEPEKKQEARPKPAIAHIVEPTKVDDKLVEKEPVAADNPYAGDDPYANTDGTEREPEPERPKVVEAPKIIEKPKVVVAQKSNEILRITEDITPPVAISQSRPSFPAEAKAAGIEGTVIVKFVVTETGDVKDVSAVRGPPELRAVCEEAVKSWRFKPALKDGQPVAVSKTVKFPFKINT